MLMRRVRESKPVSPTKSEFEWMEPYVCHRGVRTVRGGLYSRPSVECTCMLSSFVCLCRPPSAKRAKSTPKSARSSAHRRFPPHLLIPLFVAATSAAISLCVNPPPLPLQDTYDDRELEKALKAFAGVSTEAYKSKVEPGCRLSKQIGNTYTASVFANIVCLVCARGAALEGETALVFSYGSG